MLVAISDLHLDDGTRGKSLSADAFHIFSERMEQLALSASMRRDGKYRPVESIDLLLLGDIIEMLYSTRWVVDGGGAHNLVRPWSSPSEPGLVEKVQEITQAILEHNNRSLETLRNLASGEAICLPPADAHGNPDSSSHERLPVPVNIYYMVGNHDWFYHLPGEAFDHIRQLLIDAMGLKNPITLIPHEAEEWDELSRLFKKYRIYARHGDIFDRWCYNAALGRNSASLGDALCVELLNRFPSDVEESLGDALPSDFYHGLNEMINIRPNAAISIWLGGQFRRYNIPQELIKKIKRIWDQRVDEFLSLDFVRSQVNHKNPWITMDELVLRLSRAISFRNFSKLLMLSKKSLFRDEASFAKFAITEAAFKNRQANYIVYGHTHRHELVPLDAYQRGKKENNQYLVNTGTWRSYYDLSYYHPEQEIFLPSQLMSYLAFYTGDERRGRRHEAWMGNLV